MKAGVLAQGLIIFCMYRGAYDAIEPVYQEMANWMVEYDCQGTGVSYEYYYNDTAFPEEELLTKVIMPLQ